MNLYFTFLLYFSYNTAGFGYFVIGYLFGICCIAELICNKIRSSEINLYSPFREQNDTRAVNRMCERFCACDSHAYLSH